MAIPTKVFALAGTVALALLILLLGCVFDETDRGGTWWSLFTALCYLMAITSWLLFQPGFICATDAASLGMEENGICGGQLWQQWGAWMTAFAAMSSFGLSATLMHNDTIGGISFITSNVAGFILIGVVFYEAKYGAIRASPTSGYQAA